MIMMCLVCRQAETTPGFTSVSFARGELRLAVDRVPAWICPHCGESYLEEDVAIRLLGDVEAISNKGNIEGVHYFS